MKDSSRNMSAFDAVLWDIDGTLADSEPVHALSFQLAAADVGLHLPPDFHDAILGRSEAESHDWMCRSLGLSLSLADWTERRYARYFNHIERINFMPGAQAVWQAIDTLEVAQAVVSNSDRMIVNANLARLGLNRPGQISISRNDVLNGKPHPEPYLRAAELLGVDPRRTAVVEDSKTGMMAGLAAGMTVFMMLPTGAPVPTDARSFADLAKAFAHVRA